MAYSLADRFPKLPTYYPLLDPGKYETIANEKQKVNVAPFLSKSPRVTHLPYKIWTHVIYSSDHRRRIPNCSTITSRLPRFPYEVLKEDDLSELICECDTQYKCECRPEKKEENIKTETKRCHRIFTGPPPRLIVDNSLSRPCATYKGYKICPNRNENEILDQDGRKTSYFRGKERQEFSSFYRGCKWSSWTAKRKVETVDERPGPTSYNIKQEPTQAYICGEKVRASRRKTSKQYRFIESILQKNRRENLPGPASYNPNYPKGPNLRFIGSKAERFRFYMHNDIPGPSDYKVKRDLDLPEPLKKRCHAKLPDNSGFGVKAPRFKPIKHECPGPARYNTIHKSCILTHCQRAPFDSSTIRFADDHDGDEFFDIEDVYIQTKNIECTKSHENWMFKSHTLRMMPLKKKLDDPSPADLSFTKFAKRRSQHLQNKVPFDGSQPRFQPWFNWIPVHNMEDTPGPGEYKLQKVSCLPAVTRGPVFRSDRFKCYPSQTPPCNVYKISNGLENILHTHNIKLKANINKKHAFRWTGLRPKKKLSEKERESHLISRCISLLNIDIFGARYSITEKQHFNSKIGEKEKKKTLRCFLNKTVIPNYF